MAFIEMDFASGGSTPKPTPVGVIYESGTQYTALVTDEQILSNYTNDGAMTFADTMITGTNPTTKMHSRMFRTGEKVNLSSYSKIYMLYTFDNGDYELYSSAISLSGNYYIMFADYANSNGDKKMQFYIYDGTTYESSTNKTATSQTLIGTASTINIYRVWLA